MEIRMELCGVLSAYTMSCLSSLVADPFPTSPHISNVAVGVLLFTETPYTLRICYLFI